MLTTVTPNQDQVLSAVRTFIALACGLGIANGYITSDTATLITAFGLALVPLLWGVLVHTNNNKIAAAEALPNVQAIVVPVTASRDSAASKAASDSSRPKVVFSNQPLPKAA